MFVRKSFITTKALCVLLCLLLTLSVCLFTQELNANAEVPEWAAGTSYQTGDLVSYQGKIYECLQPHQALPGWEPANVASLWQLYNGNTPIPSATATATPTTKPSVPPTNTGFKVSGYIKPDVTSSDQTINSAFTIALSGTNLSTQTNNNGYFEINNVPPTTSGYSLMITKTNYLARTVSDLILNGNAQLGSQSSPVGIWAGDVAIEGKQDNVINMGDIMEIAKSYNTASGDTKYNADIDFNKDTAINMSDIMIIVKYFNKTTADYPDVDITITTPTPTPTSTSTSTPTSTPTSNSSWGNKIFAPYAYTGNNTIISNIYNATGQKYYTVAFVVSDANGNAVFDAGGSVASNYYGAEISKIRSSGGDVMISFGGYGSTELAQSNTDLAKLEAKYQSVIDMYKVSWLDFDIEMSGSLDSTVVARRNTVLKTLQDKNPGLKISYTLPVAKTGLLSNTLSLLNDAKAKGVKVESVDIMTFDFGGVNSNMGTIAVNCAKATYDQIQKIDPNMEVGIITMINRDDDGSPFNTTDAQVVLDFAQNTSWVRLLSFWECSRDSGYTFTKIFKAYQ